MTPEVMCGSEIWTLSRSEKYALAILERKTVRRIFGTVEENGVCVCVCIGSALIES
jgi:hypothetical protein